MYTAHQLKEKVYFKQFAQVSLVLIAQSFKQRVSAKLEETQEQLQVAALPSITKKIVACVALNLNKIVKVCAYYIKLLIS